MVLFTSRRPLGRCENLTSLYEAYGGEKAFLQTDWRKPSPVARQPGISLMVADDYCPWSPGKLIMIGHGVPIGKSYGLDQPIPYYRRESARYLTHVTCAGKDLVSIVARQSGIPESSVLPIGMPRTDAYVGKKKGDGGTLLAGRRAYLYAPTFRNRDEPPMASIDWDKVDAQLSEGEMLVVKPHMMTGSLLHGPYRHIVEISSGEPTTPYLVDCDVLVTDYSSIMFDAHIMKKPVVLFEKTHGFTQYRKMYLPYPDGYGARYATDENDLVRRMRAAMAQHPLDAERVEALCDACDGHSVERHLDLIRRLA